ncbi:cytoplasmic protein [Leisingera aquaemixtae]|uniref:cytoplasmic protein n=1 Tax=Leisingera aquaemixtae TaxID=1396826 RepID=UPI003983F098
MTPSELKTAHGHSSRHRSEIERSQKCGCFHCTALFSPSQISDWCDEEHPQQQWTAICPKCGIDSVIGDASGIDVSPEFLTAMNKHWF